MEQESFYSDEIAYMLLVKDSNEPNDLNFTTSDGAVNWNAVGCYFEDYLVPHDQPLSYEHCYRLTPKFHTFLTSCPHALYSPEKLKWTNRLELIAMTSEAPIVNLTSVLTISSILEYSLGNVYLTESGSMPPHLLRDLLMTDTLATVMGETVIYLLRLLLGTPNGINLRNLVWHGFLSEEEVSPFYSNFLLLVLITVGDILEERNIAIKHRSCPQDTRKLFQQMGLVSVDELQLLKCLENNKFISTRQMEGWKQVLKYYEYEQYYFCISLALPQLEMYLRRLYSQLYQRDFRAKLEEYYIIMDTVFEECNSCTGDRNKIHKVYSTSMLELVYDLLSAMNGPRIRDKLSHGELQLEQVDDTVTRGVLLACYVIITNGSDFVYKSLFHPNAILRLKLEECKAAIDMCQTAQLRVGLVVAEADQDIPIIPEVGITDNVNIFYRPKGEEIAIGMLMRIATTLRMAAKNMQNSLVSKLEAMEKRELRSRARNTFTNMMKMLPVIWRGLDLVMHLLTWIFHCLMQNSELDALDKLVRFLKFILKYTENAANNLDTKNNTWLPLYDATRRELYDKTRQNLTLLLC
ncbi:endoplasmic reticulum membrane-associated RNA degradation protein-like [Ochlerotatus camptorhynchus]|uniref:endoplasmic reticulum membrane-associated RNA degradation protein-like n=1 Tax=Ochlerotatus camptorhynchus TaxID=644619 RepID=UPI0031DDE5C6